MTATLRNIMHGRMQPIPAFVSPACADVIRKALIRSPTKRIRLDELADHPWVRIRAQDFGKNEAGSGSMTKPGELVPTMGCSHAHAKQEQPDASQRFRTAGHRDALEC